MAYMTAQQDWDIKARGDHCSKHDQAFQDNEVFYSRLSFGDEGYVREDFCEACWAKSKAEGQGVSHWKSVYRVPAPPPEEVLRKETAESLLRKFMEEEDPSKVNVMYILAVMLERRRMFVERDVQVREDGVKLRIYEHRETGETFLIPDPELRLTEITSVQDEVVVMLGGKPPGAKEEKSSAEDAGERAEKLEED